MPGREWYAIDYENIELRIFAYASGDENIIQLYREGKSFHDMICQVLHPKEYAACQKDGVSFKSRYKDTLYQWVKNGDFALIYGASPWKADATFRVKGAYSIIRKKLPLIDEFMTRCNDEARKYGYVTTLGGYRLQVPEGKPHVAVNYFVQGSAGLVLCIALPKIVDYLDTLEDYYCTMNIHDEFVFDFPRHRGNRRVITKVAQIMQDAGDFIGVPTPVSCERIRTDWGHGEDITLNLNAA